MIIFDFIEIILKLINPGIRRIFIIFIGLRAIRQSLNLDIPGIEKLLVMSDEICMMFAVPIAFQLLFLYSKHKAKYKFINTKWKINLFLVASALIYSLAALLNGPISFLIILLGYLFGFATSFAVSLKVKAKEIITNGAIFSGFFCYIVLIIFMSDHLVSLTIEHVFLLIMLPRVAYSNFFTTFWQAKLRKIHGT